MPNNDYILRSDALKAILGVSIYDTIEELEGTRTIAENTWADGLYDAYKIIEEEVDAVDVEPRKRWIPVTERLPEYPGRFMCVYEDEEYGEVGYCIDWGRYDPDDGWYVSGVTHWMPIPDLPENEMED